MNYRSDRDPLFTWMKPNPPASKRQVRVLDPTDELVESTLVLTLGAGNITSVGPAFLDRGGEWRMRPPASASPSPPASSSLPSSPTGWAYTTAQPDFSGLPDGPTVPR